MNAIIDASKTMFLAIRWSIGGQTHQVEVKPIFLGEMKKSGMFESS